MNQHLRARHSWLQRSVGKGWMLIALLSLAGGTSLYGILPQAWAAEAVVTADFQTLLKQQGWLAEYDVDGNLILRRLPTSSSKVSPQTRQPQSTDVGSTPPATSQVELMRLIARLKQAGWIITEDGSGGLFLQPPAGDMQPEPLRAQVQSDAAADGPGPCDNSLNPRPADMAGCGQTQLLSLPGLIFRSGSAELDEAAKRVLQAQASPLLDQPGSRFTVLGHTDSVGGAEANMRLSQRRADAVREYLIAQGVSAQRINAEGRGETEPVADNATRQGRRMNRRVELRIFTPQ